jgi:hypothetical protein
MTLQRFIFEDTEGNTVGEWTVRDIGHEMEENHSVGTIIVLGGKRFEIIGSRSPTLPRDKDRWARIKIVWPHTA